MLVGAVLTSGDLFRGGDQVPRSICRYHQFLIAAVVPVQRRRRPAQFRWLRALFAYHHVRGVALRRPTATASDRVDPLMPQMTAPRARRVRRPVLRLSAG
jgi:hypothetical protein